MICRTILNETSYFGKGAIKEIANEVINRGLKKVMLVTDKDLLKFKLLVSASLVNPPAICIKSFTMLSFTTL